jgi:MFS superfamily sulfate permease-like transporter
MASTISLNPIDLMLISSLLTGLVLAVVLAIFRALAKKEMSSSEDAFAMYIGGEHESILTLKYPITDALYWAALKRVFKNVYRYLVESLHTGSVFDWVKYMSMWYGFLMILAILIVMMYMVMGW